MYHLEQKLFLHLGCNAAHGMQALILEHTNEYPLVLNEKLATEISPSPQIWFAGWGKYTQHIYSMTRQYTPLGQFKIGRHFIVQVLIAYLYVLKSMLKIAVVTYRLENEETIVQQEHERLVFWWRGFGQNIISDV